MLTPEQLIEIEAACDQCSAGFGQQRADAERFVVALRGADVAIADILRAIPRPGVHVE